MGKGILPAILLCSFISQAHAYVVGSTERYLVNLPNYKVTKQNVLLLDIGHRFTDPFEKKDANGDLENPFYDFLGVDNGANISFAVAYGIGNLFDVSVARYSISKLYIFGSRVNILNERADKTPMSLSIEPNIGFRTERYTDEIAKDRKLTTGIQLIAAKDFFNENLVFTIVPSYQINTNVDETQANDSANTLAIGGNVAFRYSRWSYGFEYNQPLLGYERGEDSDQDIPNLGFSIKYRTYQHTFSFVVSNHPYGAPADFVSGGVDNSNSDTNLRLGFNITRELDFLTYW